MRKVKYRKRNNAAPASASPSGPKPKPPLKIPATLEEAIQNGRCIIFLGAGSSVGAGAPSWRRLLEDIAHRFSPNQHSRVEKYFSRNDAWGAADLVCGSAPRPELNTFVRDRLEIPKPMPYHLQLCRSPWAAIFTTNYDTLVEQAYRTETLSPQQIVPVYQFSKDYNIHENSKVHLFKLHGSVDQIHLQDNVLVLTTKDLTDTFRQRSEMLSQIPRLLIDYYWLFVGYGFGDGILRQLLNEVKRSNRDTMPRESFAVLPRSTDEDRDLLNPYRISIIPATAEEFFKALDETVSRNAAGHLRIRKVGEEVHSGGVAMRFSAATRVAMDDQFEVVGPVDPDPSSKGFFLGGEPSWRNIAAGLDFRRDSITNEVIRQIWKAIETAPEKAIVISGPAGSGKSTILRRVGWEIATGADRSTPVIALRDFYRSGNRYADSWDAKLIGEVARESKKTIVILIDNIEVHYRLARNLFSTLRGRDVKAVIVGAVRSLDWSNLQDDYPMPGFEVVELPDSLQDIDIDPFVSYLNRNGLVRVDAVRTLAYWRDEITRAHEHHLLGVMRSLSGVSGEAFDEKIITEFYNLPERAKRAYEWICLTYQFGFPMPIDLLLILLNCSDGTFAEEVLQNDKDHVIIEAAGTMSGRIAYKARHRIIAQIVANAAWDSTYAQCDALCKVIENINSQSEDEYRVCRSLLMSEEVREKLPDIGYRRRLFDAALVAFPDDNVFYQHYAKIEMEARPNPDFQKAHDLLNSAIAAPDSDHNPTLQHTRGMLYLHQAGLATEGKRKYFEKKAEEEFTAYRKKDRGSEYGYYTHARMLMRQRSETGSEEENERLLARALEIVREGLSSVEEDDLSKLPLLEAEILGGIDPAAALRKLDKWIKSSPTPEAYFMRAVIRFRSNDNAGTASDIAAGLDLAPDYRGLLLLRVELMIAEGGYCSEALLAAIRSAMLHSPDSARLAFEAGVLAYHLGQIPVSQECFGRASAIAGRAGRPKAVFVKDASQEIELNKKVRMMAAKWGGTVQIPLETKPEVAEVTGVLIGRETPATAVRRDGYADLIFIRPQDRKDWMRPGDAVKFAIAFNNKGPLAVEFQPRNQASGGSASLAN